MEVSAFSECFLLCTFFLLGVPIPGEVNVAIVIYIMPLNSVLNPFLYTLNTVLEKRREKYYNKLVIALEARVRAKLASEAKESLMKK